MKSRKKMTRLWMLWIMKGGLLGAAARRQGDSRCVCSDGGAVWRALCCAGGGCGSSGWSTRSTRRGSLTLACGLVGRCVSSAGLMAAICLPGEVRRPVPSYYLPGGALGVLSWGADASLRAAHCFNRLWISCSSFSRCSALRKQRGAYGCHLPARGGPPTCAGLLLAWWSVGDAVGGRGRFAARCALLQQALDFMQLFFLDLCFTALLLEEPTPF